MIPTTARHPRAVLGLAIFAALAACDSTEPLPPDQCALTPASCTATLSGDITSSRTLRSDTVYTLAAYVHVTGSGTVLTIEPGTVTPR